MSDPDTKETLVDAYRRLAAEHDDLKERFRAGPPARPLFAKLAAIYGEMKRIPKNGWNDFHKYAYTTDEDVVDALRPLFAKHGVAWWPTLKSSTREKVDKGNGKFTWLTTVKLQVLFVDPQSGDQAEAEWEGTAYDADDKGIYKALTGALKYALQGASMQSSGEDPERVSGTDRREAEKDDARAARNRAPDAAKAEHNNEPQWAKMVRAFAALGITRAQIEARTGKSAEDLSVQQLEELKHLYDVCAKSPQARATTFPRAASAATSVMNSIGKGK